MERRYELETLRRSLTMLTPGAMALSREDALHLVGELLDLQRQRDQLAGDLRQLLGDGDDRSS